MKSFLHFSLLLALVNLLFLSSPVFGQGAAAPAKIKKIPFHGKIVAVDQAAGTITLNGKMARVLHVTSSTVVLDGSGNPTTLAAASVNEDVGGSYTKDASGLLTAAKLRIGAKAGSKEEAGSSEPAPAPAATTPAPAPAPAPSTPAAASTAAPAPAAAAAGKKTRFSGKVTAVDASASTITIKTRTFTVSSASKITDSTGAAATLADIAVGTKVSGSYEKSADGATMTVDTVKIAK